MYRSHRILPEYGTSPGTRAMPAKPKLLLVGHSYHAKTGSSRFLLPLLEQRFELRQLLDDSWRPGAAPLDADRINAERAERILFWQQLPDRRQLRRLHCRNLSWAPMHDGVDYRSSGWAKLAASGLKLLNFSAVTQRYFSPLGFDCLPLRYYPALPAGEPAEFTDAGLTVFFWVRREALAWPQLKALLGAQRPRRIALRYAPDPNESPALPSAEEIAEYRIELIRDWLSAEAYAELLAGCNVFVAPRLSEGIGMATLEAMARGMAIVAADAPTMNEYLVHGESGYLFDPDRPRPLDLRRAAALGQQARKQVQEGHQRWLRDIPAMLDFIDQPGRHAATLAWRARALLRL